MSQAANVVNTAPAGDAQQPSATGLVADSVHDGAHVKKGAVGVVTEDAPLGLWREGSAIDRLDKRLSMQVFQLNFGGAFETILSVPGTWFGMPVPAFIMSNLLTWYNHVVAELAEDASVIAHLLNVDSIPLPAFLAVSIAVIMIWSVVFFRYWFSGHIEKAYLLNKHWTVPSIIFPVSLGRYYTTGGYKAGTFFIVSWFIAQALSAALKTAFSRTRPTAAPSTSQQLKKVKREYSMYQKMLSVGESVFESFPSGDSVGAAVFSATLFLIRAPTWSVFVCLVTAFGRMYFHAHHLLDVSAGLAIGWIVPLALNAIFGINYFDLLHTAIITMLSLGFFVALQRFKPKLPEHLVVKGRKGF